MADTMNDSKRIYLSCPTMHGDEQRFVAEAFDCKVDWSQVDKKVTVTRGV